MASEASWLERVLIALSESDTNLLNEYNSTLTIELHSSQKCSDEDLVLLLADKRKLFRDFFRAESYIPANIISEGVIDLLTVDQKVYCINCLITLFDNS